MMAAAAVQGRSLGSWPVTGPVTVVLEFVLAGNPTGKPDVDNLAKAVLDALGPGRVGGDTARGRGRWAPLLWHDDAQVTDLVVRKRQGEPGLRLTVGPAEEQAGWGDLLRTVEQLRARVAELEAALRTRT